MNQPARQRIRAFYEHNPHMVSSPFGGITDIDTDLFRSVLDRLDIVLDGKRVLDVGCGRGFNAGFVAAAGGHYTGVDMVVSRSGFRFAQAQAEHLPFSDGAFDIVFCIDAFEHFPDPDAAMTAFRRVIAPGGLFFLSAPNYGNVAGVVKRVYESLGWYAKDTWAPFGKWQAQELEQPLAIGKVKRLAAHAGFQRVRYIGHGAEVGLGICPWIAHPRMPEAIMYRLQRGFAAAGPALAKLWPGASLHVFYRIEA